MASQFKNMTVKVSLTDGNAIQGVVTDIVNGQLLLSNGTLSKHPHLLSPLY